MYWISLLIARRRSGKGVVILSVACRGNALFRLPNDAKVVASRAQGLWTMIDRKQSAAPAGRDILPPEAAGRYREMLADTYASHGYDRETSACRVRRRPDQRLRGRITDTFRLMDPVSRMMGVQADMTTQVARIAATRLDDCRDLAPQLYRGSPAYTRHTASTRTAVRAGRCGIDRHRKRGDGH